MLDEQWSDEVEEIGDALAKVLAKESTSERVRRIEAEERGYDAKLHAVLAEFGAASLEGTPELFARVAMELGRALASVPYVETYPVLHLLGREDVALAFDGLAPAVVSHVAVRSGAGAFIEPLRGDPNRTAAGDMLVRHVSTGDGEPLGDNGVADRLWRFAALMDAARMTGAGHALLQHGVRYARERVQFGKPIGSFQGVAHRLADAAIALDAAELLVRKAAFSALPEGGGDGSPSKVFALMVHAKAVEASRLVATHVHQTFGGNGFAMEYDVQLFSRRLRSWAMRGQRPSIDLAELARTVLDPKQRDSTRCLWHYDVGMPLPRWAREADGVVDPSKQVS